MLDRHDNVVRRFAEACQSGDIAALRDALDADAIAVCDGGGVVAAPLGPVHGAQEVVKLVAALLFGQPDAELELTIEAVNGRTGLALRRAGHAVAVVGVGATASKVTAVWMVLNPAKLGGWHLR